jgi:hypothetical protein
MSLRSLRRIDNDLYEVGIPHLLTAATFCFSVIGNLVSKPCYTVPHLCPPYMSDVTQCKDKRRVRLLRVVAVFSAGRPAPYCIL